MSTPLPPTNDALNEQPFARAFMERVGAPGHGQPRRFQFSHLGAVADLDLSGTGVSTHDDDGIPKSAHTIAVELAGIVRTVRASCDGVELVDITEELGGSVEISDWDDVDTDTWALISDGSGDAVCAVRPGAVEPVAAALGIALSVADVIGGDDCGCAPEPK
jgi:hypothetical protein